MEFKINGQNKELNFGVKFAALLDESDRYGSEGIEFGMGIMLSEQKLEMGSLATLANVITCASHQYNDVTSEKVYAALDIYVENDELDDVFDQIELELKNSKAVRSVKARAEKMNQEANRKEGAQAAEKPTKQ